jgi:uncharacterized protein DUF6924/lectin domain-containing protein
MRPSSHRTALSVWSGALNDTTVPPHLWKRITWPGSDGASSDLAYRVRRLGEGNAVRPASSEASVFDFRTWHLTTYGWKPDRPLTVHLSAGTPAAPEQLTWIAQDGTECAIAFSADLLTFFGHRRTLRTHVIPIRGDLVRRGTSFQGETLRGYEFDTETLDGQWRPAGRLRVQVEDGNQSPPRSVAWRDQLGSAYSLGVWLPGWSRGPNVKVVAGLKTDKAGVFTGYRHLAGHAPEAYRGRQVNAEPPGAAVVVPAGDPTEVPQLPPVDAVPLVRTDFSDDEAWAATSREVTGINLLSNGDVVRAYVDPVDDSRFDGLTGEQLSRLVPPGREWPLLLVADRTTMTSVEHHVLVVDLDGDNLGRTFRAVPEALPEIENNLSIGNMDWEDFADSAGDDGVVRSAWG